MSENLEPFDGEAEYVARVVAAEICLRVEPLTCPEMSPKPASWTCDGGEEGKTLQLWHGSTVVATLFVPGEAAPAGTKFTFSMPENSTRAFVSVTTTPQVAALNAPLVLSMRYDWGKESSEWANAPLGFYVAKISPEGVAEPDYPCGGVKQGNVVTTSLDHLSGFILAQGKKPED
jgi:hypothetical protein